MAKKLIIPNNKNLDEIKNYCDGFILGIKDLCVNNNVTFNLDEIKEIVSKYSDKDIFVSLNKNMHAGDLEVLKETLINLENINIKGIFYYDISIVEYKKTLNLKHDLVWNQEHLTTNYNTCNYWYDYNVLYSCLSSEITLDEIKEISDNVKGKLMLPVFGYIPMYTSYRHVVKNYLDNFKLSSDSKIHYIKKEGYTYPIVDTKEGTTVYSSFILNSLSETLELKDDISYFIFNAFLIPNNILIEVLKLYDEVTSDNFNLLEEKINKLINNLDKGFLYKETIYKVK